MNKEDKELLYKDLCSRLPYKVKIEITWWVVDEAICMNTTLELDHIDQLLNDDDTEIKPYLSPMSSMTEEEKYEFRGISNCKVYKDDFYNEYRKNSDGFTYIDKNTEIETFNWLNGHHFDYRDLIKNGLAMEAPEGMYKEE